MRTDIGDYLLVKKNLLGDRLQLFFKHKERNNEGKVLQLHGLAAFIDRMDDGTCWRFIEIREPPGSSYNMDVSLQLKRPEIMQYPEVFLLMDNNTVSYSFRAVAQTIVFRDAFTGSHPEFL